MRWTCFSALQRAENSSIQRDAMPHRQHARFSALQRAENSSIRGSGSLSPKAASFSALQRAENSSIRNEMCGLSNSGRCFSALQRAENSSIVRYVLDLESHRDVSVLFSEPKIPQYRRRGCLASRRTLFQCSSASRKFLNISASGRARYSAPEFQCSSASRKFLNL